MERQSVRGALCKLAEESITRRADNNDASLIDAIIPDAHSDFVSVSASYLASLEEIKNFVPALDDAQREKFLLAVLTELSEHLKVNKDKDGRITIRTEYKRNPRNTLIMHSVPDDAKESDLLELFRAIPTAASVSFKKDVNSCWLATFDTEANAVATHRVLYTQNLMVKGRSISVGLRATRFIRVTPAPAVSTPQAGGSQSAGGVPPGFVGMRQVPMRQPYPFPPQYFMQPVAPQFYMQPYYPPMQQVRSGPHQPGWVPQQRQRNNRGGGHQRYQNAGHQQQRVGAPEQMAAAGVAPVAATPAAPATAAAPSPAALQQQQQPREGQRQGQGRGSRNSRNRNRGNGGNRGHAAQTAATEPASAESRDHHPRQSAAAERQEQAKPQEKPTADSFPPLM